MIVSVQSAIDHLRLPIVAGAGGDIERDLIAKTTAAEGIVLDYLKANADPAWTDEATTPALIVAAILLQLGELWRFRGDDPGGQDNAQTAGDLAPTVTNILRRYRYPAIA